ncbi:MAG TPA: homocysteine S-methyltransferase family protein [Candidatus Brocadiia bacterium]|nr:homocysteine S-methyltransferase family protein [Candidatus Brocadiia bacterium]
MGNRFQEALASGRVLVCDGAMGSELQKRGLSGGDCPDQWNITRPEVVRQIHSAYVQAGAGIILTNTFGANRIQLAKHNLEGSAKKICKAAVALAREAAGPDCIVLGDIGPTGEFLEPLGNFTLQDFEEIFREQAEALIAAGADGIIVETMTSVEECAAAIKAVKSVSGAPVVASMAFEPTANGDFRTMMGASAAAHAKGNVAAGADALGVNCGCAIQPMIKLVEALRKTCAKPIMAQPNAGQPKLKNGLTVYEQTPADFAANVPALIKAGANIVGSCCGTTPEFTRKIAETVRSLQG